MSGIYFVLEASVLPCYSGVRLTLEIMRRISDAKSQLSSASILVLLCWMPTCSSWSAWQRLRICATTKSTKRMTETAAVGTTCRRALSLPLLPSLFLAFIVLGPQLGLHRSRLLGSGYLLLTTCMLMVTHPSRSSIQNWQGIVVSHQTFKLAVGGLFTEFS